MITNYETRQHGDDPRRPAGTLTLDEISKKYDVKYTTLQHWVRAGHLERVPTTGREIRIRETSVVKYLQSKKVKG